MEITDSEPNGADRGDIWRRFSAQGKSGRPDKMVKKWVETGIGLVATSIFLRTTNSRIT